MTEAQRRANKRYSENHEIIKVCFNKGTVKGLKEIIPYVREYYGMEEDRMKTVQDFIRFSVEGEFWKIMEQYAEVEQDSEGKKIMYLVPYYENENI